MVRFEHLNLVVEDISRALGFYKAAFPHWKVRSEGQSTWNKKPRRWVHFGDEYQYLTFNDNGVGGNRDLRGHKTGLAHFAVTVSNLESVIKRLGAASFKPSNAGEQYTYRKNIYFIDPDGFEIEFVEYLSDVPTERNNNSLREV